MGSSVVRYKVKPGRADENAALVKAVYEQLGRERPDGLHYARSGCPTASPPRDVFETDQPPHLGEVAAFTAFTATESHATCRRSPRR
jgi:hypothetical protein